jgi:glutamate 5-kinase
MAKRWVIKLGSGLLTRPDGKVDRIQIGRIADQVARLMKQGIEVVIVSSGAVAAGMTAMELDHRPKDARELQACATVGQPELMSVYGRHFQRHKLLAAQMLLTYWDLDSKACTRNARATLDLLLKRRHFVPIINENDAIADEEIRVGDNDRLSAHVASLVEADLLIILSGVQGLMTKSDGTGELIPTVKKIDESIRGLAGGAGSERNVGGMITKLQAAEIAAEGGVDTIIAHGRKKDVLLGLAANKKLGTRFSLTR